jgi:hypothetical protein
MDEFRIWIAGHAETHCRIKVETNAASYEVDLAVTAGWKGQLSRLQWKAGALLEEEDVFLAEISTKLAQEIFPESARGVWEPLLSGSTSVLRILYRGQTGVSVLLPLELLSIEGVYFVDIQVAHRHRSYPQPRQNFVYCMSHGERMRRWVFGKSDRRSLVRYQMYQYPFASRRAWMFFVKRSRGSVRQRFTSARMGHSTSSRSVMALTLTKREHSIQRQSSTL